MIAFLNEVILKILIVATITQTDITSLIIQFLPDSIHESSKAIAMKKDIKSIILIPCLLMLIKVFIRHCIPSLWIS